MLQSIENLMKALGNHRRRSLKLWVFSNRQQLFAKTQRSEVRGVGKIQEGSSWRDIQIDAQKRLWVEWHIFFSVMDVCQIQ